MQRHKTVIRIIFLTFSVVNFVLAAPVSEWGIREVRVDVVDVAENVATTSQKRWNPLDNWWTNAALADRIETPQSRWPLGSDYRLEHEPRPHSSRSPMDPNLSPQQGSDSDNSLPLPVDPPLPVQNGHATPSPVQNGHATPQSSQELIDGPILSSHSMDPPTDSGGPFYLEHSNSVSPLSPLSPHYEEAYDAWVAAQPPSSSPSHDSNPSPQQDYLDRLNEFNHRHPPELIDDQVVGAWSDPVWHGPHPPGTGQRHSDPGPPRRPYSPTISEQTTGAYLPPDPSTATPSDSEQSSVDRPASGRWSEPAGALWPYSGPPPDQGRRLSDPGPPRPHSPSNSEQSTGTYPVPDPPTPHLPSPPPLQQESENILSELFREGRVKRRISDSRSVNVAQRRLQSIFASRDSAIKIPDKIIDAPAATIP